MFNLVIAIAVFFMFQMSYWLVEVFIKVSIQNILLMNLEEDEN